MTLSEATLRAIVVFRESTNTEMGVAMAAELLALQEEVLRLSADKDVLMDQGESIARERDRLTAALAAIIYASDGCMGHADCNHSMEPWQEARRILGALDAAAARGSQP